MSQAPPVPTLNRPVSQTCTINQFAEPAYTYWCSRMQEAPRTHRKQWEYCYILQALALSGMLAPGRRGLGYGVGLEPLPAVLCSLGCTVLGTDQAAAAALAKGWTNTDQFSGHVDDLNTQGLCPAEQFGQLASYRTVDMNHIPADLRGFDFTWSSCALEHLGSIAAGLRFIEASLAPLDHGGAAVHTTELNCSSDTDTLEEGSTVIFRRRDFAQVVQTLRAAGHRVLPLNFHPGASALDAFVDVPPFTAEQHTKLQLGRYVSTSFGLIIYKNSGPGGAPTTSPVDAPGAP